MATTTPQRGLGERKELRIVATIVAIGLVAVLVAWLIGRRVNATTQSSANSSVPQDLHDYGPDARGPSRVVVYKKTDKARIAAPAVGRDPSEQWHDIPQGVVVQVVDMEAEGDGEWYTCRHFGALKPEEFRIHASFLKPYQPLELDRVIELSDVRLLSASGSTTGSVAVAGGLRNITRDPLEQVVVLCLFHNQDNQEVDRRRAAIDSLRPYETADFRTDETPHPFTRMTIQIAHASHEGLRNYLSAVEIKRGRE